MRFTDLLRTLHIDFGAGNEFLVLCIAILSMLVIAAYLLLSGRTIWHTLSGVIIAVLAVLYLLDATDIFYLGGFSAEAILDRVVHGV